MNTVKTTAEIFVSMSKNQKTVFCIGIGSTLVVVGFMYLYFS